MTLAFFIPGPPCAGFVVSGEGNEQRGRNGGSVDGWRRNRKVWSTGCRLEHEFGGLLTQRLGSGGDVVLDRGAGRVVHLVELHQATSPEERLKVNKVRIAIAALALSAAGFVGLLNREGYEPVAYPDPVHGTRVPTLGFGSTEGVRMGDTIDPVAAVNRSLREIREFEHALKQCIKVPLHQYEYDAYVELSHNIGPGAFCRSTIVKRLNVGDYPGACEAILLFKRAGNQDCSVPGNRVCAGLWKDRLRLHAKCKGE
ncbi:lysozyme [Aeromonas enteropelogenes]|uniref:lysozyme n=1 Tax=Aeromonas enteropelogenes TaxID=29489 RepID=UPI002285DC90|nr:lysozyme [Aeromonas enteropelogenes]